METLYQSEALPEEGSEKSDDMKGRGTPKDAPSHT